jgi:hypothetical protein
MGRIVFFYDLDMNSGLFFEEINSADPDPKTVAAHRTPTGLASLEQITGQLGQLGPLTLLEIHMRIETLPFEVIDEV